MLTIRRRFWLHRILRELFFAVTTPIQKLYWRVAQPYLPGAKTFIFNQDMLLLVRLGYAHKGWVLPGGGINKNEQPEAAAIREAKEESGLELNNLKYVGERSYTNELKRVTVFYYYAEVATAELVIDGQEIIDAEWFYLHNVPKDITPGLRAEIDFFVAWREKTINTLEYGK